MMADNNSCTLLEEISDLKSRYGVRCDVVQNVGNYKQVVGFTPENLDLNIKFHLPDNYPNVAPDIHIKSNNINLADVDELNNYLSSKAKEFLGNPMVETLYEAGKTWLDEKGVTTELKMNDTNSNSDVKHKKQQKKKSGSADEITAEEFLDDDDDDEDDDESSDDEVVDHLREDKDDTVNGGKHSKLPYVEPNYFICVRVNDPEIQEAVIAMQEAILEVEPRYAASCIPPAGLHITLCNLNIDGPEQRDEVCKILHELQSDLVKMARSGLTATLEGVDILRKRVLHVKVLQTHENQEFLAFVNKFKILLKARGINILDKPSFLPHMPILKTDQPMSYLMKKNSFDIDMFGGFEDLEFGIEKVYEAHLCSLKDGRGEDGFYTSLVTLPLDPHKSGNGAS